jgi:hypothetical protein
VLTSRGRAASETTMDWQHCWRYAICLLTAYTTAHMQFADRRADTSCCSANDELTACPPCEVCVSNRCWYGVVQEGCAWPFEQVQLNADLLMLCTDVDGLYTGNPNDIASKIIPTYCPEVGRRLLCCCKALCHSKAASDLVSGVCSTSADC